MFLSKIKQLKFFSPASFSIHWWFLPELDIIVMVGKWQFSNSIFPFTLISWHSIVRQSIPLFYLIYVNMDVWILILFCGS